MKISSVKEKLKLVTELEWDKIPQYKEKIFLELVEKGVNTPLNKFRGF